MDKSESKLICVESEASFLVANEHRDCVEAKIRVVPIGVKTAPMSMIA